VNEQFSEFISTVDDRYKKFVIEINRYFIDNNCQCEIKTAKSGFVVSYISNKIKRTIATFVSRKTGMKLRIYPEHLGQYESFLNTLPDKMKKEIKKASVCKMPLYGLYAYFE